MRFALVDSGLGVLPAAMHLRRLCPGAELILSIDPEGMPWGSRTPDDIAERALACAEATLPWEPDVLVLACNTASVRALDVLRSELEPAVPVVGTVPAIKPAAAGSGAVAIWATAATTGSPYQRELIRKFANGVRVTEVACPGLADAIELADPDAIADAVAAAAALTPADARAVVLGCTQYELAMDRIRGVLPRVRLYGSAPAVAAQAIRRIATRPHATADAAATTRPHGTADAAASAGQRQPEPTGQTHQRQPEPTGQARQRQPEPTGQASQPAAAHGEPGSADRQQQEPGRAAADSAGRADAAWVPGGAGPSSTTDGPVARAGSAATPTDDGDGLRDRGAPQVHVLLSGAPGELPAAALRYAEGRLLAGLRLPSPAA